MPKVYGTGVYDFRRHRVAEYPLHSAPAPAPAPPPSQLPDKDKDKPAPAGPITLADIQRDRLTRVAAANWGPSSSASATFNPDLVKEIYDTELLPSSHDPAAPRHRQRHTVPLHRVMVLEVSQYLERYLWPHFDPASATPPHLMSILLMVNEKFRENVAAWPCFHDRPHHFRAFLHRVLQLQPLLPTMTMPERTNYLLFLINAFQSLEDDIVSDTVLQLAGLRSWLSLSPGRLQMELCLNLHLIPKWDKLTRRWAKKAPDPTATLQASFLHNLIHDFLHTLDSAVLLPTADQVDESCVLYCERFMEFLIDLLSQLPTRRFLRPLVADAASV